MGKKMSRFGLFSQEKYEFTMTKGKRGDIF
jgi:hypothetical protein